MKILHLVTQRGQPYGSTRQSCENCGEWGRIGDGTHFYTDDPAIYENPSEGYQTCRKANYDPTKDQT